jgi:hypothetical protein
LKKANYDEAQQLCKSRQMSLMSLETKTENDAVANFMGEQGANQILQKFSAKFTQCGFIKGLGSSPVMTSLLMPSPGQLEWQGGSKATFLDWAPEQPKNGALKCAGMTGNGLESLNCGEKQQFGCEAAVDVLTTESV